MPYVYMTFFMTCPQCGDKTLFVICPAYGQAKDYVVYCMECL